MAFLLAFSVVAALAIFLPSRRLQNWICGQTMVMTVAYVVVFFIRLPR